MLLLLFDDAFLTTGDFSPLFLNLPPPELLLLPLIL